MRVAGKDYMSGKVDLSQFVPEHDDPAETDDPSWHGFRFDPRPPAPRQTEST